MNKNMNIINRSDIINKFYSLIVIYLLFGWLIESQRINLILLLPTIQFQFLVNNCLLIQLENNLLKNESKDTKNSSVNSKLKQLNINISPRMREYLIHGAIYSSFLINYMMLN